MDDELSAVDPSAAAVVEDMFAVVSPSPSVDGTMSGSVKQALAPTSAAQKAKGRFTPARYRTEP